MDRSIQKLLGIADDAKRIYRFIEGDVQKEEYQYCQMLDQLVFGDKGYVDTLGQTWEMIHDPRFQKIENLFLTERKAVFGGNASIGRQYMTADGIFVSITTADLEEYTEILGEGRYFHTIIAHPNETCPVRLWNFRLYPDMLAANKWEVPKPEPDLKCTCSEKQEGLVINADSQLVAWVKDPRQLKDASDDFLWAFIRRECPNYFSQGGSPNPLARRLFDLFRADLLGLIADYTPTPLVDAFIELETGDITTGVTEDEKPKVFLEADILEKALTYRATMRATAAKILKQVGIVAQLRSLPDPRLTDFERDHMLRMVYQSDWPDEKVPLVMNLMTYLSGVTRRPYEDRLREQLARASEDALEDCRDLQSGKLEPINQETEPAVETDLDPHAAVLESILRNPIKAELFLIWVGAEERGENGKTEEEKLNMRRLNSILTPMFTDPEFELDEKKYWEYMDQANRLGYYGKPTVQVVKETVLGGGKPGDPCLLKEVYEQKKKDEPTEEAK